jgi:hypothetical protein
MQMNLHHMLNKIVTALARIVNQRYADYLTFATFLGANLVHPTLARRDGFLRTLDWDAPPSRLDC